MTTSEESKEEEEKGADDIQNNYFISLNSFLVNQMTHKENFISPTAIFLLSYDVDGALDLD